MQCPKIEILEIDTALDLCKQLARDNRFKDNLPDDTSQLNDNDSQAAALLKDVDLQSATAPLRQPHPRPPVLKQKNIKHIKTTSSNLPKRSSSSEDEYAEGKRKGLGVAGA